MLKEKKIIEAKGSRDDLFDFHRVRPAVTEVIEMLD